MLLEGKTCWITGASRGIGRATAHLFAQHGARLILSARTVPLLEELRDQIAATGAARPDIVPMDIAQAESRKEGYRQVQSITRQLDVVVNNAGVLKDALIGMVSEEQIEEVLSVNLIAVMQTTQFAARFMKRQKSGSIVNVASIIGRTGNEGQMVYAASKAGVIGATKSAARELAPDGIRVNAIAPGVIETAMIAGIPPEKLETLKHDIKMGRLGQPEDVAKAALFLASDLSGYITGQVIGVDGGMWI